MAMWPWRRSAKPNPDRSSARPRPGSGRLHPPPTIEQLEDRLAPATVTAPVGPGLSGTAISNTVAVTGTTLGGGSSVTAPGTANLVTHLVLPTALGNQTAGTVYVQYSNTGTAPLAAPVLTLTAAQLSAAGVPVSQALLTLDPDLAAEGIATASLPAGLGHSVQFLASGATPGVLRPGESEIVPVYWAGWQQPWNPANPPFQFSLTVTQTTDTTAINWASLQSALQPAGVSAAAWSVLFAGMTAHFGTTAGSFVQELDADAAYLGTLGETVIDVSQLWSMEVSQSLGLGYSILPDLAAGTDAALPAPGLPLVFSRTFANTIVGRSVAGPLGYGWFDNWQSTLTVAPSGSVVVSGEGGSQRVFAPNGSGGYSAQPGDFGILTAPAGTNPDYLLREQSGVVTAFRPGGAIDAVRDADGNTVRAGYDGSGHLTSLTHSSGQSLWIAYNGAGLIASVTDSAGGRTTYTYDATNHYLLSVTGADGRTVRYAYDTGTGTATSGALLSVTYPDGTHDLFTYDAQGRLSTTAHDGGAEKNTWTYGPAGQLSVTDANGNTRQYFFDDRALVKTVDPLGAATSYSLDGRLNLVAVTNALGQVTTNTYDANGFLTSSTDPAGNTVAYTYTPGQLEEASSVTDANGNATSYRYDAQGNLLAITYPDTTAQQFSYDPLGDQIGSVDPTGRAITCAYNANGQMTAETFADGSSAAFAYDGAGNILAATKTADDGTVSTTTYTYATGSRQLVKVSYPNNLFLVFSYDAGGRRIQSVDQSGFTVNYQYDAVGRLARLSDGGGRGIVSYAYDPTGRLIEKDLGNGTYTTYQYDGAGNLAQLTNYGPRPRAGQDGPVNSSFAYGYDALGRMTSVTTAAGAWSYAYDLAGQLAHAAFAPASPATPGQDLVYLYDPAGNRTATVVNGVTTNYVSNSRNEYVTVGSTTYTYDDNGNLTSATGPGGTTTYGYNAAGQLVGVTAPDGTTWAYGYDALGHPTSVTTAGQTTNTLYDPVGLGYVVGTYTPGGGLVANYTYGLGLTSQVTGSGASYYDFDATGSTVGLTGAAGSYVNRYSYDPYGQTASAATPLANPFTFQGQSGVFNAGGLLSMGTRGYLPNLGRFLSADPLGITGGSPNLVEYAANDPLNLTQPTGLTAMTVTLWDSGAAHAAVEIGGQYFAQYAVPESRQGDLFDAPLQAGYWSRGQEHAPPRQTASLEVPADMGQTTAARALAQQAQETYQLWSSEADALRDGAVNVPGNVFIPGILNVFLHSTTVTVSGGNTVIVPGISGAGVSGSSNDVVSWDAVDSIGTAGYGTPNFVAAGSLLAYRVDFENEPTATAPVQEVVVTDQLDPSLDWGTFQFSEVGFGDTLLAIPAGSQGYQATVPMTWNGETFDVAIQLSFNPATGQVLAVFESIDPDTGLPPDPSAGFLPPEDGSGRGTGHFGFLVLPRAGLATGTQIRNVAFVTIGDNPTVRTDQVNDDDATQGIDPNKEDLVTIDNGPPVAGVLPLPPVEATSSFALGWWGQDVAGGSGVAYYDVYYSDNGGAFQPLLRHTTLTATTFRGTPGHTYGFTSVATDNVGNAQPAPPGAQAVTTVRLATSTTLTSSAVNNTLSYGQAVTLTATVSASDPAAALPALAGETVVFNDGAAVLGTGVLNARGVATLTVTAPFAGLHVLTATYGGDGADQGSTGILRGGLTVNRALPAFTRLTASQTIAAGTASVTLTGVLAAPTAVPAGQGIVISAGGVSTTAVIRADGSFSAVLSTGGLAAATGVYTVLYAYSGNGNFVPVGNTSTALTVISHPVDVMARVSVRLGALQWVAGSNSRSRYNYAQTVTVTNTSGATIAGPITLVLYALVNATLANASGTTRFIYVRSPYLLLGNASLAPGASLTTTMYFYDPSTTRRPSYTARVVAGGTP
jgi:RHS repeat-associated protein